MPVSTLLQHAYHGADSAALLPGRMWNRLWCLFRKVDFSHCLHCCRRLRHRHLRPLLSRRHLYCRAETCLIAPLSHSGWLSLSSCRHHCRCCCHHHDCHHGRCHLVVVAAVVIVAVVTAAAIVVAIVVIVVAVVAVVAIITTANQSAFRRTQKNSLSEDFLLAKHKKDTNIPTMIEPFSSPVAWF